MNCPNGCTSPVEIIMVTTPPKYYADVLAHKIRERPGGLTTNVKEVDEEEILIEIKVDQHAYDSHNYFNYREEYEDHDLFIVDDKGPGTVHLIYGGDYVTEAYKCTNCDKLLHDTLDLTQDELYDPTQHPENWTFPF